MLCSRKLKYSSPLKTLQGNEPIDVESGNFYKWFYSARQFYFFVVCEDWQIHDDWHSLDWTEYTEKKNWIKFRCNWAPEQALPAQLPVCCERTNEKMSGLTISPLTNEHNFPGACEPPSQVIQRLEDCIICTCSEIFWTPSWINCIDSNSHEWCKNFTFRQVTFVWFGRSNRLTAIHCTIYEQFDFWLKIL